MKRTNRWVARLTAFLLILLLAIGIWAQKQGHFESSEVPMATGSVITSDR